MKAASRLLLSLAFCSTAILAQNVGYVVDNANGQVLALDLKAWTVKATISTGSEASEMLVLPNNQFAFVSDQGSQDVSLLDLRNNTRLATIATGQGPGSLISSLDGRFLYVANVTDNTLTVIDAVARSAVATIAVGTSPVQVNLSPDGRFAYTVNQDDDTISVIDTNRNTVVNTLPVGHQPVQFAVLGDLNTAYVVNTGSNNLSVVDLTRNAVIGTPVAVGQGPAGVAISSDSRLLYVVNSGSNDISVVDTASNKQISTIPVGAQPVAMVVTYDSLYGYVANQGSSTVSLVDLTTRSVDMDIVVGTSPSSLMLDPDENYLYVTNLGQAGSGSVTVIDVNTDTVKKTIQSGGAPVQFTMLNAPTLLEIAPKPASQGSTITLNGESFLPSSVVRFTTTSPPRTVAVTPDLLLDSQGLRVTVPPFPGSSAIVDVLNPDGNSSEQIALTAGVSTVGITPGGVVEAAGFTVAPAPISGNTILAIFGSYPGMTDQQAPAYVFPLPVSLGNAQVTFNGVPAPLLATIAASNYPQINAIAPVRLAGSSSVRVAVTAGGQTSPVETVNVASSSPGIFVVQQDGMAAAVHGAPPQTDRVTAANPAHRGETLVMFVTGLGNTTPPPMDGLPAPGDVLAWTTLPVGVSVGGVPSGDVSFSGLTPGTSGLYQINFVVPQLAPTGDNVPMVITAGPQDNYSAVLKAKLAVQ